MTKRNNPFYPNDADYKTNSQSYYDYLARINALIKELAEKIWDYEKELAENIEEIERVLNEVVNKIGEGFNDEIEILLREWVNDGTLDHIINETLMNEKADRTELEALETVLTDRMNTFISDMNNEMQEFEQSTDTKIEEIEQSTDTKIEEIEQSTDSKIENINESTVYNNGIRYEKLFDPVSETTYYLTFIPYEDELTGERLELKQYTSMSNPRIVEDFAKDLDADFAINGGWGDTGKLDYVWIEDGEIKNNEPSSAPSRYTLGIKEDGTLASYHNTRAEDLINDGVIHAHTAFTPIILNGRKNTSVFNASTGLGEQHPRQVIGQKSDKSLVILTTDGRGYGGLGMTSAQVADIMYREGVDFAYMTDGGGSTQTVVRHQMINTNTNNITIGDDRREGRGNYKRTRQSVLYIETPSKKIKDHAIKQVSQDLGNMRNKFERFAQSNFIEWFPYIYPIGGSEDQFTYEKQEGNAVRIGNMVFAFFHLKGYRSGSQIGNLRLARLPYYAHDADQAVGIVNEFEGLESKSETKLVDPYLVIVPPSTTGERGVLYTQFYATNPETGLKTSVRAENLDDFDIQGVFIYPISIEHYYS